MNKDNTSDVESSNTASQAYAGLEEADKAVKEGFRIIILAFYDIYFYI